MWLGLLAFLAAGLPSLSAQIVSTRTVSEAEVRQLRTAALGFVEKGQWASASASTDQLLLNLPADPVGLEIRKILDQYQALDAVRRTQRDTSYRASAAKVAESVAKQAWEEALAEATRTADLAPTKADLAQAPWFAALVDKCAQLAQDRRDKGEWMRATTIYAQLSALHQDDKEYKAQAKKTARYARLEATYRDKEEAAKQIARVSEAIMVDALHKINGFYVTAPNYRKMTLGGLDSLLGIVEVPTLGKAFEALADKDKRDQFRRRLIEVRDKQSAKEEVTLQGLADAYVAARNINKETLDLPEGVIIREFFDGSLEPLDPFSTLVWPTDKDEFDKQVQGEFSGVGIQIALENGQLTVVSPLEDTPAFRAGIHAGDVITAIDGESTDKITLNQAVSKITGEKGTAVVLTIRRPGSPAPRDFRLIRDKIRIITVKGFARDKNNGWDYFVDKDFRIGYVRITNYMKRTVEELEATMDVMASQNVRALIIDLRFNPGGLLPQAVEMSDLFVDQGVIVSTEGRAMAKTEERAHSGGTNTTLPLVVLVNGFSASAAEIVSGALRDHDRAIIIGERTYGKGSVQNVIPVGQDKPGVPDPKEAPAYMKLTTAYYYLPNGKSIHRRDESETWGVEPSVKIELTHEELQDIMELRRASDILHTDDEGAPLPSTQPALEDEESGATSRPAKEAGPPRTRLDVQLDVATFILRAELLRNKV